MIETKQLFHRHGGRIVSVRAIYHDSGGKGRNRWVEWGFRGRIEWDDGTVSEDGFIPASRLCIDGDSPTVAEAEAEHRALMTRLDAYLASRGKWVEIRNGGWQPHHRKGEQPLE